MTGVEQGRLMAEGQGHLKEAEQEHLMVVERDQRQEAGYCHQRQA